MKERLNSKQLRVLDDLFAGDLSEQQIYEKHGISRSIFDGWLGEPKFCSVLNARIAAAYQQSTLTLARYAPIVSKRLIALTESDKPDIARRACLDIIEMGKDIENRQPAQQQPIDDGLKPTDEKTSAALSDSQASAILEVLAEKKA
jgi:hypothetical protein